MTTEEFLAESKIALESLHKISNAVEDGITNNPDYAFLKGRIEGIHNTCNNVLGQLKYRLAQQKANSRKKS